MKGKVKMVSAAKGFGFIKTEAGDEYFFHKSALQNAKFDFLREGQDVEFVVGQGPKGPRAEDVRV